MVKYFASEFGYDVNNIIGLPYDWRLSPSEMERRDSFFTQMKHKLETAVKRHQRPAIVMAHSMGNNLFMYFCEWLKVNTKSHDRWLKRHVWAYVGFAAPLLGSPGSLKSVFSGHTLGLTISEAQAREMELTFSSTHLVNPRCARLGDSAANNPYEYDHSLVTLRSASGSSNISFGIKDVENGEIFRLAGNLCRETKLADKYTSLQELYINDPLKPLTNQFERPAIRHVFMVYGVDIPSEVGYSYSIPESSPSGSDGPYSPVLDEILVEEPCGSCVNDTIDDCPVDEVGPDNEGIVAVEIGSSSTSVYDKNLELANTEVTPEGESISAFSIEINETEQVSAEGYETKGLKHPAIFRQASDRTPPEASTETVGKSAESKSLQTTDYDNKTVKSRPHRRKKCKADIYVVKQGNVRGNKKRFLQKSKHYHTGDYTIPYTSLSYAQSWLQYGDDHRESYRPAVVHKANSHWPSAVSMGITVDPAVFINSTVRTKTGETTVVVEVEGVDHLEIIKNTYVLSLVFEHLLPLMSKELWLEEKDKPYGTTDEVVPVTFWSTTFGENPFEVIGMGIVNGLQGFMRIFGGTNNG
jgi:hypothetical protein